VLIYGDSLSTGVGVAAGATWTELLSEQLTALCGEATLVNASQNGRAAAEARDTLTLEMARHRPAIVIIEVGAVDALRHSPVARIRQYLARLVSDVAAQGAVPMVIAVNPMRHDADVAYANDLATMYDELQKASGVVMVRVSRREIAARDGHLLQSDRLHPSKDAQALITGRVWTVLEPVVRALHRPLFKEGSPQSN
jgi:acyl-CoA thioesterase-1